MNDDESRDRVAREAATESAEQTQDKTQLRPPKTKIQSAYSLPHSGPEVLSKILKAYVITSKQGAEAIKYTDVAAVAGVNPTVVSRNNSFLAESGFIVTERYGYYKPSPETIEFAKHAPWDEVGAKEFIRKQIGRTWFGETVRQQFQMFPSLSRNQQIKAFGVKSLPDESDANKLGFLFDFLVYFDYVIADEQGNYTLRRDETFEDAENSSFAEGMISDVMKGETPRDVIDKFVNRQPEQSQSKVSAPHIHININITPSTTDQELDSLVKKPKFVLESLRRDNS